MNKLSDRLNRLSASATLAMSQKSQELKAQGVDVINMSVGEPDFNTPDAIKEAAIKAVNENYSRYSPVPGYPVLRNAIVEKLKKENGLEYTAAQISVSNGAKQSVCNAIMALVNPGDEVIVPAPYWVSYPEMVKLADGTPVTIYAGIEQNFKITAEQLEAAITPKTKMLILCSPSNPTGSVYSKEELKALADVLAKYPNVYIIADEIYEHINYIGKHESIAQFENVRERVIIVNGVSKAYAMTGWRVGYLAAPKDVAKAIAKKEGLSKDERDKLEENLTKNLAWITSGKFGNYTISDYVDTSDYDITGGYLIENDFYYDEVSKFTTKNEMKLQLQNQAFQ